VVWEALEEELHTNVSSTQEEWMRIERLGIGTESVREIGIVIVIEDVIGIGITIERGEESATTGIAATEGGTPGRTGTETGTDGGREAGVERGMTGDDTRHVVIICDEHVYVQSFVLVC
jgi:hypothetical protein